MRDGRSGELPKEGDQGKEGRRSYHKERKEIRGNTKGRKAGKISRKESRTEGRI